MSDFSGQSQGAKTDNTSPLTLASKAEAADFLEELKVSLKVSLQTLSLSKLEKILSEQAKTLGVS